MENFGLDAGAGGIKYMGKKGGGVLPSRVATAVGDNYAHTYTMNGKEKSCTKVTIDNRSYFVGQYAWHRGRLIDNYGYDRYIDSIEMRALTYATMSEYLGTGRFTKPLRVWLGLPFGLLKSDRADEHRDAIAEWMVGKHEWEANGRNYKMEIAEVKPIAQAVAAIYAHVLDGKGQEIPESKAVLKGRTAFFTIGFHTFEGTIMDGTTQVDSLTGSTRGGMREMFRLIDPNMPPGEMDTLMREGRLNDQVAEVAGEYWENLKRDIDNTWGDGWRRCSRVFGAGYGVKLFQNRLDTFFEGKLNVGDDPVGMIASGLYRAGLFYDKQLQTT